MSQAWEGGALERGCCSGREACGFLCWAPCKRRKPRAPPSFTYAVSWVSPGRGCAEAMSDVTRKDHLDPVTERQV